MSDTPRTDALLASSQHGHELHHDDWYALVNHAHELEAENARLRQVLTPSRWSREMSDAWHKAIPDVHAAFAALLAEAMKGDASEPPSTSNGQKG